jgi:hypothetical protein
MELRPITPGLLQGRVADRGTTLTVLDRSGAAVVRGALRPDLSEASFETADGRWKIEPIAGWYEKVLDAAGDCVATVRYSEIVLGNGEPLPWGRSGRLPRYRLGNDLWVAREDWQSGHSFRAEVDALMGTRNDAGLLTGIAALLTHRALYLRHRLARAA